MPLFWQPVVGLPDSITITGETTALTIETATFNLGEHYWLVEDVTTLYGTVRARNGIEWNPSLNGYLTSDVPGTPAGRPLNQFTTNAVIPIDNYIFDKNIVDLQTALEGNKQVTTDVLAHRAKPRYFKLDITVMYVSTGNTQLINSNIKTAIDGYFRNSYFGNVIQLSDILQVIHSVDGVDNVRWTTDVDNTKNRVTETDITGTALAGGALNFDFTIHDDELPQLPDSAITGDTLPGLIIRARAQNTWQKG